MTDPKPTTSGMQLAADLRTAAELVDGLDLPAGMVATLRIRVPGSLRSDRDLDAAKAAVAQLAVRFDMGEPVIRVPVGGSTYGYFEATTNLAHIHVEANAYLPLPESEEQRLRAELERVKAELRKATGEVPA